MPWSDLCRVFESVAQRAQPNYIEMGGWGFVFGMMGLYACGFTTSFTGLFENLLDLDRVSGSLSDSVFFWISRVWALSIVLSLASFTFGPVSIDASMVSVIVTRIRRPYPAGRAFFPLEVFGNGVEGD